MEIDKIDREKLAKAPEDFTEYEKGYRQAVEDIAGHCNKAVIAMLGSKRQSELINIMGSLKED